MLFRACLLSLVASAAAFKVANAPAMKLRGGASLGPLDADLAVKINAAMGTLYALEMFGLSPACDDPTAKYWGVSPGKGKKAPEGTAVTESILKWFGIALLWVNGALLTSLSLGTDATALCKYITVTWGAALTLYLSQVNAGVMKMTEGPYVQAICALLFAYLGWA